MSEKPSTDTADNDALMKRARDAFARCVEAENDNRKRGLEDIRFARDEIQWPERIRAEREAENRPCLTINKLPAFIRQVVNDARQNKPQIKVSPVDSNADPETALVIGGVVKHIEVSSYADIAYDTAVEGAVTNGFGYIRVTADYAYDDVFDMDLKIERVANPFSIYGDPNSTAADGSDWNVAFVVEPMTKEDFERQYGDKSKVDWDNDTAWSGLEDWHPEDRILVAEWWERVEVESEIVLMSNGAVYAPEDLEAPDETFPDKSFGDLLTLAGVTEVKRRTTKRCRVTQRKMTGLEILETNDWPGRYIPIIPVYGDEYFVEGKRRLKSLIHPAIDAQRNFNYWRSAATELVALSPKVPYIGPEGAFDNDIDRWNTVNTVNHPFLEYKGATPPQRQPLDTGAAAGALQEALNASDDIKAIIGMYDASLGARSNETSGKAIMARQREGDVSTFHFIDNMARAVRQTGAVIIDLIPHFYDGPRVVRIIGEDGTEESRPINQQYQVGQRPVAGPDGQPMQGPTGEPLMEPVMAMHDLTVGKYDLVVSPGPSFTTRREEAANLMMEFARAYPPAAPILAPLVAKNMDWPGADDLAKKLEGPGVPPEAQKQMAEMKQALDQANQKVDELQNSQAADFAKIDSSEKVSMEQIASKERIAEADRLSQHRSQMAANDLVEVPGPDGQATLQSASAQAVAQVGEALGAMLLQQSEALARQGQALAQIAMSVERQTAIQLAPTEIQIGPNGQKRAVKVPQAVN